MYVKEETQKHSEHPYPLQPITPSTMKLATFEMRSTEIYLYHLLDSFKEVT
jgi:hypothetical protein